MCVNAANVKISHQNLERRSKRSYRLLNKIKILFNIGERQTAINPRMRENTLVLIVSCVSPCATISRIK